MPPWLGPTLVKGGLNMGAGIFSSYISNSMAAQRERDARRENYYYNEQAADSADMRTRRLYEDLYSPQAQIAQLKDAGLSPSVYFNGGAAGMSGQTGAQGAGAAGISPNVFGLGSIDFAQIANLNADTELKHEQANEMRGENEMGAAKIADMLAEAGYRKQAEALTREQAAGQELENYIRTQGMNAELYEINAKANRAGYLAEIAYEELQQAQLLTTINEETLTTEIAIRQQTLKDLIQGIAESKSRVRLNSAQIEQLKASAEKLANDITLGWKELGIEKRRQTSYEQFIEKRIELMPRELEAAFKDLDIKERKMYLDAVTETIKSAALGAMAAASYKGGNPIMTNGKGAGGKINASGGHALEKSYRGRDKNDIWSW